MPIMAIGVVIVAGVCLWYLLTEKKRRLNGNAQRAEDKVRTSEMILLADIEALRRTESTLLDDALDLRRRQRPDEEMP